MADAMADRKADEMADVGWLMLRPDEDEMADGMVD